jgi:IS30 family transposase
MVVKVMAKTLVEGEKARRGMDNTLYRINSLKRAGFSNAEIAKKLGVHRTTVWRWVNKKTTPDVKTTKYKKSAAKLNRYYRKNAAKITKSKRQIGLNKLVADKIKLWESNLEKAVSRGSKQNAQQRLDYYKNLEGLDFEDLQRRLLTNKTAQDWESWRGDYETVKGKLVYSATTV